MSRRPRTWLQVALLGLTIATPCAAFGLRAAALTKAEPACAQQYTPATNVPSNAKDTQQFTGLRSATLTPEQVEYHYAFHRGRTAHPILVKFHSNPSLPELSPANPIKVAVTLSGAGTDVDPAALVPATTIHDGTLYVSVCVDPARGALPPGEYSGTVVVEDPRLPSAATVFTVSLQYPHWVLIALVYGLIVLVGGTTFVWLGTLRSRGMPLTSATFHQDFPAFVRLNVAGILLGLGAALLVWKSQYLDAEAWRATVDDNLALLLVIVPAFVGPVASGAIFMKTQALGEAANAKAQPAIEAPSADDTFPTARQPAARPPARRRLRVAPALALIALVAIGVVTTMGLSHSQAPVGIVTPPTSARSTAPIGSVTSTTTRRSQGVPNVYNVAAADGLTSIRSAGYLAFAYRVCSHSVAADRVRQVVETDGTVLVDAGGATDAGRALPPGSVVDVKISTGVACS
jgi:hypothetical protein